MSTWPFSMNGSRFADTVSTHSMFSSSMPSSDAMIFAISTSKPTGTPSGPTSPKSGWSNLVPTVIVPASASSAMVVPASNVGAAASSVGSASSPPPPAQPASASAEAAAAATSAILMRFMSLPLLVCGVPRRS